MILGAAILGLALLERFFVWFVRAYDPASVSRAERSWAGFWSVDLADYTGAGLKSEVGRAPDISAYSIINLL